MPKRNNKAGKIRCLECGEYFSFLPLHLLKTHKSERMRTGSAGGLHGIHLLLAGNIPNSAGKIRYVVSGEVTSAPLTR